MSAVSLFGQDLAEKLDEFAIYERLVEGTKRLLPGVSTIGIARFDAHRSKIHLVYGQHRENIIDVGSFEPVQLESPGLDPVREAIQKRRPIIKEEIGKTHDTPFSLMGVHRNNSLSSALYVPMIAEGEVIGVIQVLSGLGGGFSQLDAEIMAMVANTSAVALENAELLRETQGSAIQLAMAYDTTLEGWARALELRDKETEGHTRRVTDLTVKLAAALGTPAEEMVHIRRGALMHDIGKMGIPDDILLKPGKLDEEEWEVMRRHPQMAYDMLDQVDFLRPALIIPLYHHERWNGSGYPKSLAREDIPLAARIFAVVDVFDALSSDRPYRAAWPKEKVYSYLRENAGVEFDPKVVEAFFELLP
jgi:HD-GYP domain-containing protein (c-di-GMP phosphodiesterase class II)